MAPVHKCLRSKHKAHRGAKKVDTAESWEKFRRVCNYVMSAMCKAKQAFFTLLSKKVKIFGKLIKLVRRKAGTCISVSYCYFSS